MQAAQHVAIKEQQEQTFTTKRPVSPSLEKVLYEPFPALDHGFVRVIDYMGDDNAIVQAARVSYGKGTKKVQQDQGLINYLMRHRHSTPFEMCEIKLHIKLPIFIARQWIRHRTANVNEYSARYSILDNEFYIPKAEHLAAQSSINNQGRGKILPPEYAQDVIELLKEDALSSYDHYKYMLNTDELGNVIDEKRPGLARELARMNISLNYYTQWYWKIDLHNFMHFISLRKDSHAQYEINVYATILADLLKLWCPLTYQAFEKYRLNSTFLSEGATKIVKDMIQGKKNICPEEYGLSQREWHEMRNALGLDD